MQLGESCSCTVCSSCLCIDLGLDVRQAEAAARELAAQIVAKQACVVGGSGLACPNSPRRFLGATSTTDLDDNDDEDDE